MNTNTIITKLLECVYYEGVDKTTLKIDIETAMDILADNQIFFNRQDYENRLSKAISNYGNVPPGQRGKVVLAQAMLKLGLKMKVSELEQYEIKRDESNLAEEIAKHLQELEDFRKTHKSDKNKK